MKSSLTCSIVQSSYIPWIGYFDLIRQSDAFIFLDNVQFTRRDWRTRNFIRTHKGPLRLSVPVKAKNHHSLSVSDVEIDYDTHWIKKHLLSIEQAYSKSLFFSEVMAFLKPVYLSRPRKLVDLNRELTIGCWNFFSDGQNKTFIIDETLGCAEKDKNARLISLCKAIGANRYLTGPTANNYLLPDLWKKAEITISFVNYPKTEPISILDTLMHHGQGSIYLLNPGLYDKGACLPVGNIPLMKPEPACSNPRVIES